MRCLITYQGVTLDPRSGTMMGTELFHNGSVLCSDLPNLWDLSPHQSVGLLLTASGDLHVFLDGRHVKKVASWAQRVSVHSQWVQ